MSVDKKIGMRNIKTAISVLICLAISRAFHMEYPFYAAIAAVVSLQKSVANSLKAGKNRMLGTTAGAAVGLMLALFFPNNIIACSIGIIIVIYICNILKWNDAVANACIVLIAIMINMKGQNPYAYSFNRLLDTFIGINVAVLVNYFVFPPKFYEKIQVQREELKHYIISNLYEHIYEKKDFDNEMLGKRIVQLQDSITLYEKERRIDKGHKYGLEKALKTVEYAKSIKDNMAILQKQKQSQGLSAENLKSLENIYAELPKGFESCSSRDCIVYNFLLGEILHWSENLVNL